MGPDRVYTLTLAARAAVTIAASGGDPLLYLRAGCGGAEIACDDDVSDTDRSARLEETLEPGTYALFVDAYDGSTSDVTLEVTIASESGPDAARDDDASASADASVEASDAGPSASPDASASAPPATGGCGCRASNDARGASLLALLAVLGALAGRAHRSR
jgi:MYXO-CTERM domain-containing protein